MPEPVRHPSFAALAALLLALASPALAAVAVFSSPTEDPTRPGPTLLNHWFGAADVPIWLDSGGTSHGIAGRECSGHGGGQEACAWQIRCTASGGMRILGLSAPPDKPGDYLVQHLSPDGRQIVFNGGDPLRGELGATRIGTLRADADASGELRCSGTAVDSGLRSVALAESALARTCGNELDRDCDGVDDSSDRCPYWPTGEEPDTDEDGIGDACQCGDQNRDGTLAVSDLIAINRAIFDPSRDRTLCDANNDGRCDVSDMVAVNLDIFGSRISTCRRHPQPTTIYDFWR